MITRARWADLSFVLAIFAVSFAIRVYDLGVLVAAPDELTYASRAVQILGANWAWLPKMMWDQPPLLSYLLALVTAAYGASLDGLRLVSVLAGSVSVVIAYFLGKSMYGRKAGLVASVALAVDGYDILYSRLVYIEALATMLILGATLLFWEGLVKRRNTKAAILGGIVFGLALDAKYITLVMGAALVLFLILYRNRFPNGFPKKEVIIFFGVAFLCFVPVLLALALSNVNPFYYDLVYRFQLHHFTTSLASVGSGAVFLTGFRNFVQVFFHVSSTIPFQVFPAVVIDIPIWTLLVASVIGFFLLSFLFRRNPREGLLFLLFVAFLAFAFTYPARRTYFSLYPSLILLIMLGGLVQLAADRLKSKGSLGRPEPYMAAFLISLTVGGIFLNATAVPVTYKSGFGDWDEMTHIMTYVGSSRSNNTFVATDMIEVAYYIVKSNLNVTIVYMKQPQSYYTEPPANSTLQTPLSGSFPILWVISPAVIVKTNPEFVIMPNVDYQGTTQAFQQFITQRYFQPLSTSHVLLFQLRLGNFSSSA